MLKLTDLQIERVCGVKHFMLNKTVAGVATHEIKAEALRPLWNGTVEYLVTAGLPNDTGTMAQVFCRDTYQIFISPRGGLKVHYHGRGKRTQLHLLAIARCMRD